MIKPILFNNEMLLAIRDNRKTVTRRLVKPQPNMFTLRSGIKMPYGPGDILYVPERWKCSPDSQLWNEDEYRVVFPDGEIVCFYFEHQERREKWKKYINKPLNNWQSPYFMPREAARIFLQVTDVRVERLQDILDEPPGMDSQIAKEGCKYACDFPVIWDRFIKSADRARYGWDANPWVFVISFERISKEEAQKGN